jgi:Ca2+-binding RTX toxin-like protein
MTKVYFHGSDLTSNGGTNDVVSAIQTAVNVTYDTADPTLPLLSARFSNDDFSPMEEYKFVDLHFSYIGGKQYITEARVSGSDSSGNEVPLFFMSGLKIASNLNVSNYATATSKAFVISTLDGLFAGNDEFLLTGEVDIIFGDHNTLAVSGTAQTGNDRFVSDLSTSVFPGRSSTGIYGDVYSATGNGRLTFGNDTIIYNDNAFVVGDAYSVSDLLDVTYGDDRITTSGRSDIIYGDTPLVDRVEGGDDTIFAGAGVDTIYGGGGDDRLNGGSDADYIDGGVGVDVADYLYSFYTSVVMVVDLADNAQNAGTAAGDELIRIEGISGRDYADAADDIRGNDAANRLWGLKGDDTLTGRGGDDALSGGLGADVLYGGDGADNLSGGDGGDTLSGGGSADTIKGGAGADSLRGGSGADDFVFTSVGDSTGKTSNRDTILDFGSTDDIVLSAIDANSKIAGNQSFKWIGPDAFTGKAGELRYVKEASDTYIYGDINGDKKTDFAVHLDDAVTMKASDFSL